MTLRFAEKLVLSLTDDKSARILTKSIEDLPVQDRYSKYDELMTLLEENKEWSDAVMATATQNVQRGEYWRGHIDSHGFGVLWDGRIQMGKTWAKNQKQRNSDIKKSRNYG